MSTATMTAVLIYQMLLKEAEKEAQKAIEKEAKTIGQAIANSVTQDVVDNGAEKFLEKQVKKHLPKADKIVLGAVTGKFKTVYDAKKLPPDPSGLDPTKLKVFAPIYQPKPLSSGKLKVTVPIPLKKLRGPKGKRVTLDLWFGIDHAKLIKQQWNFFGGARLRF